MPDRFSAEAPYRRSRRIVSIANPAVGTDWSTTVPAGKVWDLLLLQEQLATSAAAATRAARLQISDGDATYLDLTAFATQITTLTRRYTWGQYLSAYATGSSIVTPFPLLRLPAGSIVSQTTDAIDAGDQWSAIQLYVVETTVRRGALSLDDIPELNVAVITAPAI